MNSNWKFITILYLFAFLFLLLGDLNNDVLEIQDDGASMCLACIGLE
ncbi:MAG: hypothetical protein HQK83_01950 [Fibrobacteria bacterium]|nr:hypothetical protein [Fibrobacteria bacterium]